MVATVVLQNQGCVCCHAYSGAYLPALQWASLCHNSRACRQHFNRFGASRQNQAVNGAIEKDRLTATSAVTGLVGQEVHMTKA